MGTPGSMAPAASSWSIAVEGNSTPTAARFSSDLSLGASAKKDDGSVCARENPRQRHLRRSRSHTRCDFPDFRGDGLRVGESHWVCWRLGLLVSNQCVVALLGTVGFFELCGGYVVEVAVEALGVVSVHPAQGGEFDVVDVAPGHPAGPRMSSVL